tara:strand:+ start:30 stop:209 length:180 start_codon:yes stop_codon:yes gene_type:complete
MAHYRYKEKISDNLVDALDIIKNAGKSINAGHAEKNALIDSLKAAYNKLESAKYYLDRE